MTHIQFDYSKVLNQFVAPHELDYMQAQVTAADNMLRQGTGPGSDFLGWFGPSRKLRQRRICSYPRSC